MTRISRLILFLLLCAAPARAQGAFALNWSTLDGGGAASAGGGFTLTGTAGQPDAGVAAGGAFTLRGGFWSGNTSTTAVFPSPDGGPLSFSIHPAQPNPSSQGTAFAIDVPRAGGVRVQVYDVAGRLVRTLADGDAAAGRLIVHWDDRSDDGRALPGGVYFARVSCPGHSGVTKLVLIGNGGVR